MTHCIEMWGLRRMKIISRRCTAFYVCVLSNLYLQTYIFRLLTRDTRSILGIPQSLDNNNGFKYLVRVKSMINNLQKGFRMNKAACLMFYFGEKHREHNIDGEISIKNDLKCYSITCYSGFSLYAIIVFHYKVYWKKFVSKFIIISKLLCFLEQKGLLFGVSLTRCKARGQLSLACLD